MSAHPGRIEIRKATRNGSVLVGVWVVHPDGGLIASVDDFSFTFVAPTYEPPPPGPPRELEDLGIESLLNYTRERVLDEIESLQGDVTAYEARD